MFALVKFVALSGIDGDVYIAATAKGVGFAGEIIVVQGDAVGMAGIQFIGGQHRLHLADKVRECFIQLTAFDVTEFTGDAGPVSQIVQPIALLHQSGSKAWRDIPLQAQVMLLIEVPHYCQFRVILIRQAYGPLWSWRRSAYTARTPVISGTSLPV